MASTSLFKRIKNVDDARHQPQRQTTYEFSCAFFYSLSPLFGCCEKIEEKMQESKDSAIKLFGRKIPLPADADAALVSGQGLPFNSSDKEIDEEDSEAEKVQFGLL